MLRGLSVDLSCELGQDSEVRAGSQEFNLTQQDEQNGEAIAVVGRREAYGADAEPSRPGVLWNWMARS
jgi:hypothetical protein